MASSPPRPHRGVRPDVGGRLPLGSPQSPRRASENDLAAASSPRTSRETLRRLSRIPRGDSRARGAAFASRRSRRRPGSRRGRAESRPRASRVTSGDVARARPHRRRGSVATEDDHPAGARSRAAREVSPSPRARLSDVPRSGRASIARQRSTSRPRRRWRRSDHPLTRAPPATNRRHTEGEDERPALVSSVFGSGSQVQREGTSTSGLGIARATADVAVRRHPRTPRGRRVRRRLKKHASSLARASSPAGGSTSRALGPSVSACSTRDTLTREVERRRGDVRRTSPKYASCAAGDRSRREPSRRRIRDSASSSTRVSFSTSFASTFSIADPSRFSIAASKRVARRAASSCACNLRLGVVRQRGRRARTRPGRAARTRRPSRRVSNIRPGFPRTRNRRAPPRGRGGRL